MKRTTIFLDENVEGELRVIAARKKQPVAVVVRTALSEFVAREHSAGPAPLSFIGIGRSGHRDTAERHEDLLWRKSRNRR